MHTGVPPHEAPMDPEVFGQFVDELTPQAAVAFVREFGDLLPHRVTTLKAAAATHREEACIIVLLSIQSGARMIGAHALTRATGEIHTELRSPHISWATIDQLATTRLADAARRFLLDAEVALRRVIP